MELWSLSALRQATACLGAALCLLVVSAHSAGAQFYVRSPDVTKGKTAIEEHGAVYSGPGEDERLRQSHEIEFKHGLTERWELLAEGTFREAIGESLKARRVEAGAQYEIVERYGDGWGLAFRTLYEFAVQDDIPDEILFGPLAKYVRGPDSFTVNTFFIGQVGSEANIDSLEFKVNWRLKRELNETVGLGVEGYGAIGDLSNAGSFDDQKHRVGPVAYFEFGGDEGKAEWELAGGALFGLSDATSDVTFKFDGEVKF